MPSFSKELLQAVQNWKRVPPSVFPLGSVNVQSPVTFKVLSLNTALELAQKTLNSCQKEGYQISVAIVDRFGNLQVLLRDRFAGPHTIEAARRKAWTAASFKTDTIDLSKLTQAGQPFAPIKFVTGALMAGGGVQVKSAGSIVAGIGVAGAPGGLLDDKCAKDGIEEIAEKLEF